MSIDILSKDILLQAQIKKENFNVELKEEFLIAESELLKRIEIFKSKLKTKFDFDLLVQNEKIIGSAKRDANKIILETKSGLLDQVFADVLNDINSLKKEERESLLKSLIKFAKNLLNYESIICSKKDQKFVKSIVETGIKIKIDENLNGLIFIGNSNKEILDFSYLSILKDIYEVKEDRLQNILFK